MLRSSKSSSGSDERSDTPVIPERAEEAPEEPGPDLPDLTNRDSMVVFTETFSESLNDLAVLAEGTPANWGKIEMDFRYSSFLLFRVDLHEVELRILLVERLLGVIAIQRDKERELLLEWNAFARMLLSGGDGFS